MEPRYIVRFGKYVVEKVSRSFAGRRTRPDIFISATSADLGTVRKIVRDALLDSDCFPVEQSHFSPDYRKVEEMLKAKITNCQAMIHIVGMRYGFEPNFDNRPPGVPRRSYTQMEYHIAKELGIRCYVFVCPENFPYDTVTDVESQEKQDLQRAHRQSFIKSDIVYTEFEDGKKLKEGVLKLQKDFAELSERVDQNRLRIWLTVLLNWAILLIVGGGLWWGVRQVADFRHVVVEELRRDSSPDRLQSQAAAHFNGKNYSGAFQVYAQLSDADPANVALHRRIEESARLGRLEKPFLDRYLALVQQQPTNAIFHNYLGNAYLMLDPQDKDGKAREHYESAVRLDPNLSPPLMNLGIVAQRREKSDEAESLFKRYLTAQPGDAQGWVNLGLLYVARVETNTSNAEIVAAADHALRKAIETDPASAPAYKGLGRLWAAMDRKKEALNAYQRSLALNFEQPDVRQQVELLAWESGGIRADDFKTRGGFRAETNTPAAIIAMQLLNQGQFPQAETICLEWTKLEPDNPLAWRLLGRACERQGRADDARRAVAQIETLLKQND